MDALKWAYREQENVKIKNMVFKSEKLFEHGESLFIFLFLLRQLTEKNHRHKYTTRGRRMCMMSYFDVSLFQGRTSYNSNEGSSLYMYIIVLK